MEKKRAGNIDLKTVEGFGQEWSSYTQENLNPTEHRRLFDAYFSVFPFHDLSPDSEGFDLGCGSGRWAVLVAPRVARLHCIDPAKKALDVARRRLSSCPNAVFHEAGVDQIPLADGSQDFGYSLGVLHHIPDSAAALADCVRKLKPGAPFLLYLYYSFDNREPWYEGIWKVSEFGRKLISRLPFPVRKLITTFIAGAIYYPMTRIALLVDKMGGDAEAVPLSAYRHLTFYSMRTDALDRFGTRLEQRFSRADIEAMMVESGLEHVVFREGGPYWVACGRKSGPAL